MPLTTDDFARLALCAADALASKGTPLVETIDKIASDNEMNLEQIKRLCEASNNAAFKALFDKKEASDREVTFDVAKAEDVVGRRRQGASKVASAPFDLHRELAPLARAGQVEKVAAAPYVDPLEERARQKTASAEAVSSATTARLTREHLEAVESAERYKFAQDVEATVRHYRGMSQQDALEDLVEVEKSAAAELGDLAMPFFGEVRRHLALPALETDLVQKSAFHPGTLSSSPISMRIRGACKSFERARSARMVLDTPGCIESAIASHGSPAS